MYRVNLRTTSALEGFNSLLSKKITANGNFFHFISALTEQELSESREFKLLIESGGASSSKKKKKNKRRNDLINDATDDLDADKITTMEFLNRMIYKDSSVITADMSNFVLPPEYLSDNEQSDQEEPEEQEENQQNQDMTCVVCKVSLPKVMFRPCNHFKCCKECSDLLVQQYTGGVEGVLCQCPCCRSDVLEAIEAFT